MNIVSRNSQITVIEIREENWRAPPFAPTPASAPWKVLLLTVGLYFSMYYDISHQEAQLQRCSLPSLMTGVPSPRPTWEEESIHP